MMSAWCKTIKSASLLPTLTLRRPMEEVHPPFFGQFANKIFHLAYDSRDRRKICRLPVMSIALLPVTMQSSDVQLPASLFSIGDDLEQTQLDKMDGRGLVLRNMMINEKTAPV